MKQALFILLGIFAQSTVFSIQSPNPQQQPSSQNWINDQQDQTDTYAIPSDSSEEEEKDEMQDLQKQQKKKQQKKSQQ